MTSLEWYYIIMESVKCGGQLGGGGVGDGKTRGTPPDVSNIIP